jgi:hypothetical protein
MKSHEELVATLKSRGMVVGEFTLTYDGAFTGDDVDWNYKDMAHLFHMHPGVRPVLGIIEHEKAIFINLQSVLGLRLPLCMVSYHPPDGPETYFTAWLFYVLVVSTRYSNPKPGTCLIETDYSVCAPKPLFWTLPIVRWLIKRNYRWLMEGDAPMRNRRAELRARGYTFRRAGDRYSFLESLKLGQTNVVPPAAAVTLPTTEVNIDTDLLAGGEVLLGDDGHLGLRLVRNGDRILAFPRLCDHEGASLDGRPCTNSHIQCPWHGRIVPALAELGALSAGAEETEAGPYRLVRTGSRLRIEPLEAGTRST